MAESLTIAERRAKLDAKMAKLQGKIDVHRARYAALYRECKHPRETHGRDYSGGSSSYCPDCGRST